MSPSFGTDHHDSDPGEPTPTPAEDDLEALVALLREFADWDARPVRRFGYLDPL